MNPPVMSAMPFHFWSVCFLIFGAVVGSFLNVCIYRMPRGESLVYPPSHCPRCNQRIRWYHNLPLITWISLRGRCAYCGAAISPRYLVVELLTGLAFLACWLRFGLSSPALAAVFALLLAGFIVAAFIDLEHYFIPDEITIGGAVAGFLISFGVPLLHDTSQAAVALRRSIVGIAAGALVILGVLQMAKWLFGRQVFRLPPNSRVVFHENHLQLPDRSIPYEDIFFRKSDVLRMQARQVRGLRRRFALQVRRRGPRIRLRARFLAPERFGSEDALLSLSRDRLSIGPLHYDPADIQQLEAVAEVVVVPREGMGLGDVKFMAAVGAFLGWPGVAFTLMASSVLGTILGGLTVLIRRDRSSRIPYVPYLAMAATIWIFFRPDIMRLIRWWLGG